MHKESHISYFVLSTGFLICAEFGGEALCSQRFVLSVSQEEVTEAVRDKEMCCGEKTKRRRGRAGCWEGRSHGEPQDLVVKVAHFP